MLKFQIDKKNVILNFDIISFFLGIILYFIFCLEIKVDLIKNIDLISWPSANNRPLVFIYIFSHFYIFTRLLIEKYISNSENYFVNFCFEDDSINNFYIKFVYSIFLTVFVFYGILFQHYNEGLGTFHVAKSLNDHLTVILAPLHKIYEGGKFYLDAKTGLIGPFQQLMFFLIDQYYNNATDIYRFQLLLNYITVCFLIFFLIFFCGVKWGSLIFFSIILTKVGILPNFNYPGWGIYLRWLPILIMAISLSSILFEKKKKILLLKLYILSLFWTLLALFSKENFLQPIISFGVIFFFQIFFLKKKIIFFKYLFYLIIFFIMNFIIFSVATFGVENFVKFFHLYTDFTSRYFWGQNSLFLTDRMRLFQDSFALFVVGKTYLSIFFQIFLGMILFNSKFKKKISKNLYISLISVLAASIALNMASFFRADLTHVRSTGMLTLTLILLTIFFYYKYSIKNSVNNFIFFLMFLILIVDIHYSISHSKNIIKSLINFQRLDSGNSFFETRSNFNNSLLSMLKRRKIVTENFNNYGEIKDPTIIKEWNILRNKIVLNINDVDTNILKKVSSNINEQRYFFMRYHKTFNQMINFKTILGDSPLVSWDYNFPEFRIETLIYLLDLKSAGKISSPMTNLWNVNDLKLYQEELFSLSHYCYYLNENEINNVHEIKNKWFPKNNKKIYFLNHKNISIENYVNKYKVINKNHFLCYG